MIDIEVKSDENHFSKFHMVEVNETIKIYINENHLENFNIEPFEANEVRVYIRDTTYLLLKELKVHISTGGAYDIHPRKDKYQPDLRKFLSLYKSLGYDEEYIVKTREQIKESIINTLKTLLEEKIMEDEDKYVNLLDLAGYFVYHYCHENNGYEVWEKSLYTGKNGDYLVDYINEKYVNCLKLFYHEVTCK